MRENEVRGGCAQFERFKIAVDMEEGSWGFLRPLFAPLQGLLSIHTSPTVRVPAMPVFGL